MTIGIATAKANTLLDSLLGTTGYVQLHTGSAGATGASNISSVTTRMAVTFGAAASGSKASTTTPSWATWAGTNGEIVTGISVFDAITGGNFIQSYGLSASKTMATGDTLNITLITTTLTPLAA